MAKAQKKKLPRDRETSTARSTWHNHFSRLLVTGGRDYGQTYYEKRMLQELLDTLPISTLIHGGAEGADKQADMWAEDNGIERKVFLANWERDGKSAGVRRNQAMLDLGQPTGVVAFPGGRGTQDMVNKALRAGIPVIQVILPRQTDDD